jgi:hypothetical protein
MEKKEILIVLTRFKNYHLLYRKNQKSLLWHDLFLASGTNLNFMKNIIIKYHSCHQGTKSQSLPDEQAGFTKFSSVFQLFVFLSVLASLWLIFKFQTVS